MTQKLKELFDERDRVTTELTTKIIDAMPNVLEGARQFIVSHDGAPGHLSWEGISLFNEEGGFVLLVGAVSYDPGDEIKLPNGKSVVVSQDTTDYFRRLIRIGIPMNIAETGTVSDVFKFIQESTKFQEFEEDPMEVIENAEFDLEELTEEQRAALNMFNSPMRSKN